MTLNIPCHSLLACRGYPEKSADNFMQFPTFVTCCFSFAPFNSVFLSLFFFSILITMSLGVVLFGLILFWPYCVYWTWMSVFFPRLGKFSTLMSSGMFYTALSFLFASGTSIMQILVHLMLFHKSVQLSSFHFNLLFYRSSSVIATTLSFSFLIHSSVTFSLQ